MLARSQVATTAILLVRVTGFRPSILFVLTLSVMTSPLAMTLVVRVYLALYAFSPNTVPAFNLAMVISLGLFFCSLVLTAY